MAELGFVGDGPNSYQFWLGGSPNQTRLAEVYQDRVKIQVLLLFLMLCYACCAMIAAEAHWEHALLCVALSAAQALMECLYTGVSFQNLLQDCLP